MVPQFGIAKLVHITPIIKSYVLVDISMVFGIINQLITGGHHLVWENHENHPLIYRKTIRIYMEITHFINFYRGRSDTNP